MDIRDVLATNLRRYRREKRWSQEELAHRAKVNRTYVSKLEAGATYAGLEIIGKLSKVFRIEPAELLRPPQKPRRRG